MGEVCAMFSPDCFGRLEWHHAYPKSRLKREFRYGAWLDGDGVWKARGRAAGKVVRSGPWLRTLGDILGDTRNRVWLCSHHHELVTNGRLQCELPESVWEFAREFALVAQLENDLARRAA